MVCQTHKPVHGEISLRVLAVEINRMLTLNDLCLMSRLASAGGNAVGAVFGAVTWGVWCAQGPKQSDIEGQHVLVVVQ